MKIECPKCQTGYEVSDDLAGCRVECFECHCKFYAYPDYLLDESRTRTQKAPEIHWEQGVLLNGEAIGGTEPPTVAAPAYKPEAPPAVPMERQFEEAFTRTMNDTGTFAVTEPGLTEKKDKTQSVGKPLGVPGAPSKMEMGSQIQSGKVKYSWWMIVFIGIHILQGLGWIISCFALLEPETLKTIPASKQSLVITALFICAAALFSNGYLIYAFLAKSRWFRYVLTGYFVIIFLSAATGVTKGTTLGIMSMWLICFWSSKRAKEIFVQ